MQRYLGLDPHAESCTLSVLDERGKEVRREVVETNGQALVGLIKQLTGELHLCVEEGEWSQWLYEILSPHVAEMVVVFGRRRSGSKSDALDARDLAERMRTGQLGRVVFKAPKRYARLRELARTYALVSRDVARTKNRLKSLFRRRGLSCAGEGLFKPAVRNQRLKELPAAVRPAVELLGNELDCLVYLKSDAEVLMLEEARRYPISRILETVPGLGEIRVAQMMPIVVTPHRFRTKRQFWSYCGFAIVTRSTADWVQVQGRWRRAQVVATRGLNRNFNRTLKGIFKGAATTVIAHSRPTPFRAAYERLLEQGTKPNLAKVTVARKIAATTLAMWKNKEVYDPKR